MHSIQCPDLLQSNDRKDFFIGGLYIKAQCQAVVSCDGGRRQMRWLLTPCALRMPSISSDGQTSASKLALKESLSRVPVEKLRDTACMPAF